MEIILLLGDVGKAGHKDPRSRQSSLCLYCSKEQVTGKCLQVVSSSADGDPSNTLKKVIQRVHCLQGSLVSCAEMAGRGCICSQMTRGPEFYFNGRRV